MSTNISVNAEQLYSIQFVDSWKITFAHEKKKHLRNLIFIPNSLREIVDITPLLTSEDHIFYIPDGEDAKTISAATLMWNAAAECGIQRSDAIWGIGGGSTTDVAGFIAATWLRGITWYAVPTTLAGMVDAAIGGKTGINSPAGKNLIGSFHSPTAVIIDTIFLDSLSDRDISAGLAEVIKTGFIGDSKIIELLQVTPNVTAVRTHLRELVERSAAVKARVVSADFKEGKLREILNYGHTLGHAIEKWENYRLRHGEAVSIGLIFAAELSAEILDLDKSIVNLHKDLLSKFNLPITYELRYWNELLGYMQSDKKNRQNQIRFVGIRDIDKPDWIEDVSLDVLHKVYERICS